MRTLLARKVPCPLRKMLLLSSASNVCYLYLFLIARPMPEISDHPCVYAGFWKRLLADLVDGFIIVLAQAPVWILLLFLIQADRPFVDKHRVELELLIWALPAILSWLYFALFESSKWQATPGKKFFGLRVCMSDMRPLSFWRASLKVFIEAITFILPLAFLAHFGEVGQALAIFVSLLFVLVMFATERKQTAYDLAVKRVVIDTRGKSVIDAPDQSKRRRIVAYAIATMPVFCIVLIIGLYLSSTGMTLVKLDHWRESGLQNSRRIVVADYAIPAGHEITLKDVYEANDAIDNLSTDSAICSDFIVGSAPVSSIEQGQQITLDYFEEPIRLKAQEQQRERLKRSSAVAICSHKRAVPDWRDKTPVIFANRDVPENKVIAESDLRSEMRAVERAPKSAMSDQLAIIGKKARYGLSKGQIIMFNQILPDQAFIASKDLKSGKRLTSTDYRPFKITKRGLCPSTAVGAEKLLNGATTNAVIKRDEIIRLPDLILSK